MLENTLENRDQQVYKLEQEIKDLEESRSVCKICDYEAEKPTKLKKHDSENDEDLNQPTTSNCGTCSYVSDDESDLRKHMKCLHTYTGRKFECTQCNYFCGKEDDLKTHMRSNHYQLHCEECDLNFKEESKLKMHMCKVTLKNPTFGTLYTKDLF